MSAGWIAFWIAVAVFVIWLLIRIGAFRVLGDILEGIADGLS